MLKGIEKARALQEFRSLRLALTGESLKGVEKAKAIRRFRELRLLLGGQNQSSVPSVETTLVNIKSELPPALSTSRIASLQFYIDQSNVLTCELGFIYKYYTPSGFVKEQKADIIRYINAANKYLTEFCQKNDLELSQSFNFADLSQIAEAVEQNLEINGEDLYQKSTAELILPVVTMMPKNQKTVANNPIYQRVIDGEVITRDLLVQLDQEASKEATPVQNPQLVQAATIAVQFMQGKVQKAVQEAV